MTAFLLPFVVLAVALGAHLGIEVLLLALAAGFLVELVWLMVHEGAGADRRWYYW